jgi:ADP-ribose pyrophosphatase
MNPVAHPSENEPRVLGQGRFLRLLDLATWEYAERCRGHGVVTVVAVTAEGCLLLTEQYRPAVRARVIELPAGLVGDAAGSAHEAEETAARRELLEETGYEAARMVFLMRGPTSSGMTNEQIAFFRAEELHRVHNGGGDGSEEITVHAVPLDELEAWCAQRAAEGAFVDPKVYAGLYFAIRD